MSGRGALRREESCDGVAVRGAARVAQSSRLEREFKEWT